MDEPEKCPWCKKGKFDPPRPKCGEPSFHWLLAGREWTWDADEGGWVARETMASRLSSYDGLLAPEELKKNPDAVREVQGKLLDGNTVSLTWKFTVTES